MLRSSSRPLLGLTIASMSSRALEAEYAVRGAIAVRSAEIDKDLANGSKKYNFKSTIKLNTGNPQAHEQKPFSFPHQVMSILENPSLLEHSGIFPADVVERAKFILRESGGVLGAYTATKGFPFARKSVASFIEARDNKAAGRDLGKVDIEDIFLSNGASQAVTVLMTALIAEKRDGLMIPIPQYPLYTATLSLLGGSMVPYFLDESRGWAMSAADLEAAYAKAKDQGIATKALVVINPGNPTGQVLDRKVLEEIVDWAHKRSVLIIADEVYQENVYAKGKSFHSFREVVLTAKGNVPHEVQLASLETTSKGMFGECGRRGGYMELLNVPHDARAQIEKLCALNLSPNNSGQLLMDLMTRRPMHGDASFESFNAEFNAVYQSLKERASLLVSALRAMPNVQCNEIEGAMYAFPRLMLPPKFCAEAAKLKQAPDFLWCMQLLERQGVVTVPGSGFGQVEGTHHVRLTILPPKHEMDEVTHRIASFQKDIIAEYS